MSTDFSLRICIIGCGASGIILSSQLLKHGFTNIHIYEQQSFIGGQWNYLHANSPSQPHTAIHNGLISVLPCTAMQIIDYPFPPHLAKNKYPIHSDVLTYLTNYCNKYNISQYTKFNTKVIEIEESGKDKFLITIQDTAVPNAPSSTIEYDCVYVASGIYMKPFLPTIKNIERFKGIVHHSSQYGFLNDIEYSNKRILIIGGGFSAFDIASELLSKHHSDENFSICMSCKSGVEQEKTYRQLSTVQQAQKANGLREKIVNDFFGIDSKYRKVPVVDYIDEKSGNIHFQGDDPSNLNAFDIIIFATGFQYDYPFFKKTRSVRPVLSVEQFCISPIYWNCFHADYPSGNLGFMCISWMNKPFQTMSLQSEWIARVLKKDIKLPSSEDMYKQIEQFNQALTAQGLDSKRYAHKLTLEDFAAFIFPQFNTKQQLERYKYYFQLQDNVVTKVYC